MPIHYKLNFRESEGYVTDGAGETFVGGADSYPTTRDSITFGWTSGMSSQDRDRDSGVDAKFAGIHFALNTAAAEKTFQVDLPSAGDYKIRIAAGDTAAAQRPKFEVFDNTTSLFSEDGATDGDPNTNEYMDATGMIRTEANWDANNASRTETFATTTFKITLGQGDGLGLTSTIAHMQIEEIAGGGSSIAAIQHHNMRRRRIN